MRAALAITLVLLTAAAAQAQELVPDSEATEPLENWVSGYAAGFGYTNHSYRSGGVEAQLRVDLWRGLTWSAHVAYTPDMFVETGSDGGQTASFFHDVNIGGKWTPSEDWPVWLWGEAHGLLGGTTYGMGGGGLAGVGGVWKDTHLEVGAGGLWVQEDFSLNVSTQLGHRFSDWLDVTLLGLMTRNSPADSSFGTGGTHFAYGVAAKIGPFSDVTINLRWLGGERVMALDQLGTVAENIPDLIHHTFSAGVTFPVTGGDYITVGASFRIADEASGSTYYMTAGYLGMGFKY